MCTPVLVHRLVTELTPFPTLAFFLDSLPAGTAVPDRVLTCRWFCVLVARLRLGLRGLSSGGGEM